MKSKKKLLLMGVGVMGALAMGVGATSTFAWFGVNSVTAKLTSFNDNEKTITVAKEEMGALAEFDILEISASIAPVGGKTALEFAHYKASTGTYDLETGYVDAAGNFVPVASGNPMNSANALAAEVKVTIKFKDASARYVYTDADDDPETPDVLTYIKDVNNVQYDASTVIDKINDLSVDVKVSTDTASSAARIFALSGDKDSAGAATGTAKAKGTAADTEATHVVSLSSLTTISSTISDTLVAYAYVWGGSDAASGLEADVSAPTGQAIAVVASEHTA